MISVDLQWLSFNVDLNTVDTWLKANAGSDYCGLSANSVLQVHFTSDPGDFTKGEIVGYWNGLTNLSSEATNYESQADRAAAAAANKASKLASATAKLEALGLNADEIAALIG